MPVWAPTTSRARAGNTNRWAPDTTQVIAPGTIAATGAVGQPVLDDDLQHINPGTIPAGGSVGEPLVYNDTLLIAPATIVGVGVVTGPAFDVTSERVGRTRAKRVATVGRSAGFS